MLNIEQFNTHLGAGEPEDFLKAIEPHKEFLCQ